MRKHIRLKQYGEIISRKISIREECQKFFPYTETDIVTDTRGFITSPYFKDTGKRIYILGASWVENSYVRQGRRITDIMNLVFQKYQPEYCVLNGGMSGSTLLHLYNLMVNVILPDGGGGGNNSTLPGKLLTNM